MLYFDQSWFGGCCSATISEKCKSQAAAAGIELMLGGICVTPVGQVGEMLGGDWLGIKGRQSAFFFRDMHNERLICPLLVCAPNPYLNSMRISTHRSMYVAYLRYVRGA